MAKYVVTVDQNLANLYHAGIKGMKWGRRRFQNEDGSLTEAGRKRYGVGDGDSDGSSTTPTKSARDQALDKYNKTEDSINKRVMNLTDKKERDLEELVSKYANEDGSVTNPEGLAKMRKVNQDWEDDMAVAKSDHEKNEAEFRKSSGDDEKGLVPVKDAETKSFKPGDDGYEIHDAPKSKSDDASTSSERPKDFYTDDFKDKTKSDKGPEIDDDVLSDVAKKAHADDTKKKADAENLVGKAFEERQKKQDAEKREREAEKNKKEEEAEKEKNAKEREKNKKEREKEEEEAHKRGEERAKEAEKNRKEEEAAARKREIQELGAAKNITTEASNISKSLGDIAGRQEIKVPRMNLSSLSNKQMQDAIQREIIEKQYDSMFNTSRHQAEARRERTQNFFKNVGSGLAIAGSALSIALTIKQLKG